MVQKIGLRRHGKNYCVVLKRYAVSSQTLRMHVLLLSHLRVPLC
jgi:hypothetical protein